MCAVEAEVEDLHEKHVVELKKRAGRTSAEQRSLNLKEAEEIAARAVTQPQGRNVRLFGRMSDGPS